MTITPDELLYNQKRRYLEEKVANAWGAGNRQRDDLHKALKELADFLGKEVQGEVIVDRT
jgi:hypothetical protein